MAPHTVTRIFLMVWDVASQERVRAKSAVALAALVAAASDVWLHSIHANAHIVSVALTMTQLWLLVHGHANSHRLVAQWQKARQKPSVPHAIPRHQAPRVLPFTSPIA